MSEFLDNLKKAVDEGQFNSEAAKKINEIEEKAIEVGETKTTEELEKSVAAKVSESGVKKVSEDEVAQLNSEYEEKMKKRAEEEIRLATVVTLINIDEAIQNEIDELFLFIQKQRDQYGPDDEANKELYNKINELTLKYGK